MGRKRKMPIPKKGCPVCHRDIATVMAQNGLRVTAHAVEKRTTCSKSCGNRWASLKAEEGVAPRCKHCNKEIPRPEGMKPHRWRAMRYCSDGCRKMAGVPNGRPAKDKKAGIVQVELTAADLWLCQVPPPGQMRHPLQGQQAA